MARLYTCGFELRTMTAGVEITSNGLNGGAISTTTVRAPGTASLRINPAAAFSWAGQRWSTALASGTFYGRAYINIAAMPTSGRAQIVTFYDAGGVVFQAGVGLDTTGQLQIYNSANTAIGSPSATLSTGQWYCVELKYTTSTAACEARLDGTVFGTGTATGGSTCNAMYFGTPAVAGTYDIYWDDLAINDATGTAQNGYPGLANMVMLRPNAAGSVNTFATAVGGTAGTANNFTRVNETTPNDVTSYNGSSTLNQEDMFTVGSSGITSSNTVTCVQVGFRYANITTADTAATIRAQVKKSSAGTVSQSAAIIPNSLTWKSNSATTAQAYPITLYLDPDGTAWTNTTIGTMQIGYKLTVAPGTAGRVTGVTNVWAYVEYTAASASTVSITKGLQYTVKTTPTAKTKALKYSLLRPIATLSDNFDDGVMDTTIWESYTNNGTIGETGGVLQITTSTLAGYNGYSTHQENHYNLTGSSVYVQVVNAGNQSLASLEVYAPLLTYDVNNTLFIIISGGSVGAYKRVGATTGGFVGSVTYNSTTMKYFRISESGGTLSYDYAAATGGPWTNIGTTTTPSYISNMYIDLQTGVYAAEASGTTVQYDNLNILGATVVGVTKSLKYTVRKTYSTTKGLRYAIKTGPAAITKAVKYTVRKSLSTTKGLQYTVRRTATAITKSAKYTVKTTPTAATKALRYAIRKTYSPTKALKYTIKAPVALTKQLKYTIKTGPAAITKSARYAVRLTTDPTKQLKYAVKAPTVALTKGARYAIKRPVSLTKALKYTVPSTAAAITKAATYRVRKASTVTKGLVYEVRRTLAITKGLQYRLKLGAAPTKPLTYRVRRTFSPTKSLQYIVQGGGLMQRQLKYTVRTTKATTKSLRYAILNAAAIAFSYNLKYTIRRTATPKTKALQYTVRRNIPITKSLKYTIKRSLSTTKGMQYTVRRGVPVTKALRYTIKKTYSQTKALRYTISRPAAALTKAARYTVAARRIATLPIKYEVLKNRSLTKQARYTLRFPASRILPLEYQVSTIPYRSTPLPLGQQANGIYLGNGINTVAPTQKDTVLRLNSTGRDVLAVEQKSNSIMIQ